MKIIVAAVAALGLAVAPALAADQASDQVSENTVKSAGASPQELGQAPLAGIPAGYIMVGGALVFVGFGIAAAASDDDPTTTTVTTN